MVDWAELTLFLYITARMSGFILFNPILNRRNVVGLFRAGMILVFSVFVMSVSRQAVPVPVGIVELSIRLLLELGVGALLGMAVSFFFYIPQMTGTVVDTQMGMTMNQIYDAGAQANLSVTGVLLNTLMTLLFFAANGHHTLIRLFLTSDQIAPFGQVTLGLPAFNAMLNLFVQCTLLGVKMAMPILAAELVAQVGMGILMKVIPQINVFAINIELKVIIGLVLLLLLTAPFSELLLEVEATMLNSLGELLQLTG